MTFPRSFVTTSLHALVGLPLIACSSAASPGATEQPLSSDSIATEPQALSLLAATPSVHWTPCGADAQAQGAKCGQLAVPLDRRRPAGAQIDIYFELYAHTATGPAESAILVNPGGPGTSSTSLRSVWVGAFGANLDVHDLLVIDDRGRGLSSVIDCESLQHGTGRSLDAEIEQCAAQMGAAGDVDYATGDIALDTDAVRDALGYDKVDYYGGSWGGIDATAYATRFGQHVRSLILDSPEGPKGLVPLETEQHQARATLDEVRLECGRSPSCSPDHPDANAEFAALAEAVRVRPVSGTAFDLNGNATQVTFDERLLVGIAINGTAAIDGTHGPTGELLAAAASLAQGDPAPLLRLGAEAGAANLLTDAGPPADFSWGAFYATACSDLGMPYSWSVPRAHRLVQLGEAVAAIPCGAFGPFSGTAVISEVGGSNTRLCASWEEPTHALPVVPAGAVYPSVPTLVVAADVDALAPPELVNEAAALFPGATSVTVSEAMHYPVLNDPCAAQIATTFLETLNAGDTTCSKTPTTVWPAVGRFPLLAANARPAAPDASGKNAAGVAERRVASVAVATAVDALKRAVMSGGPVGVGLRGGTFTARVAGGATTVTLTDCLFGRDVTVSGTVVWGADASLVADLKVAGAGTGGGTLHVAGAWEAPGPVGDFAVTGTLGGKTVAVVVPEA